MTIPADDLTIDAQSIDVRLTCIEDQQARIDANVQWIVDTLNNLLTNLNRMPGFKGMMARKVTSND